LKVSTVRQDLMSDGSEFQVRGAATENARRARSLRVLGTVSTGRRMTAEDELEQPSDKIQNKTLNSVTPNKDTAEIKINDI